MTTLQPSPEGIRFARGCLAERHDHGTECHSNCPTCRGSEVPR